MPEQYKNRLIARWLEGRLPPEELAAFEKTAAYQDFLELVQGMDRFKKPTYDHASLKQGVLEAVDASAGRKTIRLRSWLYAAAAVLLIFVSLGVFFAEKQYTTGIGEQLAIQLPDGSRVQLNAASRLNHNRFFWASEKTLTLEGEAFFHVEQAGEFHVNTSYGTVSVLGTKFNIRSRKELFELSCYEGIVQFGEATTMEKTLLSAGENLYRENRQFIKDSLPGQAPSWVSGISEFTNVPLAEVLQELQYQYGLSFDEGDINTSARFSGSFVHNNLSTALQSVLLPMGISYELQADQKTIRLSKEDNPE